MLVFEDTSVAAPDFAPPPGAYPGPLNVTMSTATVGATIRYTTDGSPPTTNSGTIYTAPVPVPASLMLAALAYKDGSPNSDVVSGRYFISTLAITTATLPHATNFVPYATLLTASGGTPPYLWTNIAGALPAGLNLAGNGIIAGTPVSTGSNTFTVRVTDDLGANVARQLALIVVPESACAGALAAAAALFATAAANKRPTRQPPCQQITLSGREKSLNRSLQVILSRQAASPVLMRFWGYGRVVPRSGAIQRSSLNSSYSVRWIGVTELVVMSARPSG